MRKKVKRNITRFLILLVGVLLVLISIIGYYTIINEAPILRGQVDLQIGYKDQLNLDIYHPTNVIYERSPVVIYVHGGAWITGTKGAINFNRFNEAINELRANGYAIVCPNYTLARSGESPFPHCIIDVFDAIRWVNENAETYNFDLENVGLLGESAGSHIAMMTAFAPPSHFGADPHNMEFKYLLNIYGPNDLSTLYHAPLLDTLNNLLEKLPAGLQTHFDLPGKLFGFDPEKDSTRTANFISKYSPVTYMDADMPPMLIIHGDDDRVVPVEQSITLHEQLTKLGVTHEFHIIEGVDHAFRGVSLEQKQNIQEWTVAFIRRNYSSDN